MDYTHNFKHLDFYNIFLYDYKRKLEFANIYIVTRYLHYTRITDLKFN